MADLSLNFSVSHFSVEVTVRGQDTKHKRKRIRAFVFSCCNAPRKLAKRVVDNGSKAALLSSYSIFSTRKEPSCDQDLKVYEITMGPKHELIISI